MKVRSNFNHCSRQIIAGFALGLFLILTSVGAGRAKAASVSLSATPTLQTVTVGQTATYTIKINRDGYTDKVTLSATGLPAGATAAFNPNTTTAASSVLTVKTLPTTPIGTFSINVKGTASGITIAPIIVKLTTQPVPSISVSVTPSSQSIIAGQSTSYDIAINRFNFDGKLTLSAENVPSGVTVIFEPETTYGNSSRMFLYSGGLPFLWQDYGMLVRASDINHGIDKLVPIQLHVNYGLYWAAQFGAPNNQTLNPDFATDVTYDSAGNVYLTGYSYNMATNDNDTWVAKFDASGNQLWLRMISSLIQDLPTDVFVDAAGNVYAAGSTLISSNPVDYDIFVVKIDANAAQAPQLSVFGTPNEEGQSGLQFGADSSGNTTLTAVTRVRRAGTGFVDSTGESARSASYDITRYAFAANFNRTTSNIISNAVGNPKDLAVSSDGSVYVLSEDASQIGPDHFLFVTSQVEKFNNPTGQNYRSQPIGPTQTNAFYGTRLKVDAGGNVFAVGNQFDRQVDFMLYFSYSRMIKLNPTGTVAWQTQLPPNLTVPAEITEIKALDIDASGNIYYAGLTWDSLHGTNPNSGAATNPNARTDAWYAKFSGATGTQIYLNQFNVNDHDGFNAVKVGTGGAIYFAGYTLNFKNINFGYQDALLLRCSTVLSCG